MENITTLKELELWAEQHNKLEDPLVQLYKLQLMAQELASIFFFYSLYYVVFYNLPKK